MTSSRYGWILGTLVLVLAIVALSSFTLLTAPVFGANATNDTTVAKVYVWNTEPRIDYVTVSPSPVNLNPGTTTLVNCTANIFDWNGWQDIANVSGILYERTAGLSGSPDNNIRYINDSCGNANTSICSQISETNISCSCLFNVQYYANNGSWTCNMSVTDGGGNSTERPYNLSANGEANFTINTVLGIGSPAEINYGNLSVTEVSSEIPANISNYGNVPINISVRGFGGTDWVDQKNLSMTCELNNITVGYQRYAIASGVAFGSMNNLTNTSANISNFHLVVRTNDTEMTNDTNTTYWRLEVPLSAAGACNGTIEFTAYETPYGG